MCFLDAFAEAQQITIIPFPLLPENVVATNYVDLQLISSISGSPLYCDWATDSRTSVFYVEEACYGNESDVEFSSVCEQTENSITLTYTIRSPLFSEARFAVSCLFSNTISEVVIIDVQGNE